MAAVHNGIVPMWASKIEAFPIEVTRLRFPDMIHVDDITKLNGAELPPVDIICGPGIGLYGNFPVFRSFWWLPPETPVR